MKKYSNKLANREVWTNASLYKTKKIVHGNESS